MRSSLISLALFAAGALAAPIDPRAIVYDVTVVDVVDVVTVVGNPPPKPTPVATPAGPKAAGGSFLQGSDPAPSPAPAPAPTPTPDTSSPDSSNDGSPLSGDTSILSIVNKFRGMYNLGHLAWDDQLVNNARKTGSDDRGVNEHHELNPGSYAQCITPGFETPSPDLDPDNITPFEMAYLGWMCESASDPQLSASNNGGVDLCAVQSKIMSIGSADKGHYDILVSPRYKTIGCAFVANPSSTTARWAGLWTCDLGA
jgi:uncharacterized protein YkwD